MTQFEIAVSQAKAGTLQTPGVVYEGRNVDYFRYQLAVHKMELSLMAKGMKLNKHSKLTPIKQYYGLKGRTAKDCLAQFEAIQNNYKQNL